ncbi:hypothetical protein ES707_16957 [subsurface metagenome]
MGKERKSFIASVPMKPSDYVWVKAMADLMGISIGRLYRLSLGKYAYWFNEQSDEEKKQYVENLHKSE